MMAPEKNAGGLVMPEMRQFGDFKKLLRTKSIALTEKRTGHLDKILGGGAICSRSILPFRLQMTTMNPK